MKPCNERWNDRLIGWVLSTGDEIHISEAERREIQSHLETCGACRSSVRAFEEQREKMDGSVAELVPVEPSPEFRDRLLAAVPISSQASSHASGARWAWVGLATAVAAAAGVVLFQGRATHDTNEELRALRESAAMITNWRPPTDSLTRLPGPTDIPAPLRFGEFYFTFPSGSVIEEEDKNETELDG